MTRRTVWWIAYACVAGPLYVLAVSLCRAAARGDELQARAMRRKRIDELKAGAPLTDTETDRLLDALELTDGDDDR